jgi:hypothetical protein
LSYQELEKRRVAQLTGPRNRRGLKLFLYVLFFALFVIFAYNLVTPMIGLGADPAATFASGGFAALILWFLRYESYHKHHRVAAALSLGFMDVLAFIGFVGLVIWTFVFPIINPFPPGFLIDMFYMPSLPIGVYSFVLLWGAFIILRLLIQPFTKPPPERLYGDLEMSLKRMGDTVASLSQRLQTEDKASMDPALMERVSSMVSEVAAMRKELTTAKSQSPQPGRGLSSYIPGSGVRSVPDQAGPARAAAAEPVTVVASQAARPAPSQSSGQALPDSAVDNPWLSVLSKRRAEQKPSD